MDERTAEYVDATLAEMEELASHGRASYDSDIAVARACQYDVVRLAADIERQGESWVASRPYVPWRLIKGMRNRIAHNVWTIDDDVVWSVVEGHSPALRRDLAEEVAAARTILGQGDPPTHPNRHLCPGPEPGLRQGSCAGLSDLLRVAYAPAKLSVVVDLLATWLPRPRWWHQLQASKKEALLAIDLCTGPARSGAWRRSSCTRRWRGYA